MRILKNPKVFVLACSILLLFWNCKKEDAKDLTKDFIGSYTGTARKVSFSYPSMAQTVTDYNNCNITIQRTSRKTVWITIKDDKANPVNIWSAQSEVYDANHLGDLKNEHDDIPGNFSWSTLENNQLIYQQESSGLMKFNFQGTKD